jgi:alpha-tubulin suppressor-like RCC1 family protein
LGAGLGGTVRRAAVNGVASFTNLAICKAASGYTLTATAPGLAPDTSSAFQIATGPGALIIFTVPPSDVSAGDVITPAVEVAITDACGNIATTATDSVTIALGTCCFGPGATLGGTLSKVAVNGEVAFDDLTIDKADIYTLSISTHFAVNSSLPFEVRRGSPQRLAFIVAPSDQVIDATFDPAVVVAVEDAGGNPVSTASATVTIAITPGTGAGGATLSGTTTRSTDTGFVHFTGVRIDTRGSGYTLTASAPGLASDTSVAFGIFAPLVASSVTAGQYLTSCALTPDGTAYCWGDNSYGQIGDGGTTLAGHPAPIPVSSGLILSSIGAGSTHSCGLTSSGAAYCWGTNSSGELGDGSFVDKFTPVVVPGHTFDALSVGDIHNCALEGNTAYCWGANNGGALGTGFVPPASNTPLQVLGGHAFALVSAGHQRSCALTTGNAVYCWGGTPALMNGGLTFTTVSDGGSHACGLTTGGVAYCWGENNHGQLGDGTTNSSTDPVPVSGGLTFTALSVGYTQTCGLVAGGAMYCWGDNGFGQVGDGTTTERHAPTPVSGGLTFTSVSTGYVHTCGLAAGGNVYCWGNNRLGTLGNRTRIESDAPVRVSEP